MDGKIPADTINQRPRRRRGGARACIHASHRIGERGRAGCCMHACIDINIAFTRARARRDTIAASAMRCTAAAPPPVSL